MAVFNRVSTASQRLREIMNLRGKKQVDLVKETGIPAGNISRYLSGKNEPQEKAIHKLAEVLAVSEMWLWGYDCPMEFPLAQEEYDDLVFLVERLKNDKNFRCLVLKLSELNPDKLFGLMALLD